MNIICYQPKDGAKAFFQLIGQKQYFVIHAAQQSGKTTLLLELARQLNETRYYYSLYCSNEVDGQEKIFSSFPRSSVNAINLRARSSVFAVVSNSQAIFWRIFSVVEFVCLPFDMLGSLKRVCVIFLK